MPIVHSMVPEADSHVYMPVLQQVAHHLVNSLNITEYIKNNIYIETGWTSAKSNRKNHTFFTRDNSLRIVAEQLPFKTPVFDHQTVQFAGGQHFRRTTLDHNYYKLFSDASAEIYMHENILPASFSLNCTLWFKSRNIAYETIKKMNLRFDSGNIYSLAVIYDYPLPKDITNALMHLYKHRTFTTRNTSYADILAMGKTVSFADWLDKSSHANFVTSVSRARPNDRELCINKQIENGLIQVEFEQGKPEEVKVNNVTETYNVNFTAKIQFEEAAAIVLQYPCIIDNTPLGKELIPELRRNETPIASEYPNYGVEEMNDFYHQFALAVKINNNGTVIYPFYDDWKVPCNILFSRSYRPYFCSIYYKDPDSDYLTLDLKEPLYGQQSLHPIVLDILRLQGADSFRQDCIFNITSYMRNNIQSSLDMELSDDLILKIKARDIHPQRHLVLYEITNIKFLNKKWWPLLEKYPEFLIPNMHLPDGWLEDNGLKDLDGLEDLDIGSIKDILDNYFDENGNTNEGDTDALNTPKRIYRSNIIPRYSRIRNEKS